MTTVRTDETPQEIAEANARRLMAELANAGTPRGWDGQRVRAEMVAKVDAALDEFNREAARG